MADDTPINGDGPDDEIPELTHDEFSIMRLKEDEAVVSIHVIHGLTDERWEQDAASEGEEVCMAEDHALYEALIQLWRYHREAGWDPTELMMDLEKND